MKTLKSLFLITLVSLSIYSCSDDDKDKDKDKDGPKLIDSYYTDRDSNCSGDATTTTYHIFNFDPNTPASKFYATVTIGTAEYKLPYEDIELVLSLANDESNDYEDYEYCCDVTYPCDMASRLIKIYYID